ncbi:MAG: hypothetical protein IIB94_14000 [Candidatus Marinimicrobia bacterium]|nr:hypothetical protein [Candidatus Neomarinimicrobiota bacterium]
MKKMILMMIMILAPSILFAQRPGMRGQKMHQRREQIEMLRIWKMTQELDLTEEQAGRFFPRLRADDKNIDELEKERQSIFHELHKEAMKGGMSGEKLDEKIERISEIEIKILRNRANFIKNMDDLLSTDQRAKLMVFRHRFRDRMENMMREARKNRQMMNNGIRR